jgi:hypothetical protein
MPYAQEAGLLIVDRQGMLRTHWNLCGALIFPTIAEGAITDLRARKLDRHAKARSLAGSPRERGTVYPFGCDDIGEADTVMQRFVLVSMLAAMVGISLALFFSPPDVPQSTDQRPAGQMNEAPLP